MKSETGKVLGEDLPGLSKRIREQDQIELKAASGKPTLVTIRDAYDISEFALGIYLNNQLEGIFGVARFLDFEVFGIPWLMTTDKIVECPFVFLKNCPYWIDKMHDYFPILFNYVDQRNTTAIKWLSWCGFQFTQTIESYGAAGMPFIEFVRARYV